MTPSPFLGLRTCLVYVKDLAAAKAWYAKAVGLEPYFDEPFYVGFEIGGYELGLVPDEEGRSPLGAVQVYWGVEDAQAAYDHLLALGARDHERPNEVGSGIVVATVLDPWDNPFGIIVNPHFRLS